LRDDAQKAAAADRPVHLIISFFLIYVNRRKVPKIYFSHRIFLITKPMDVPQGRPVILGRLQPAQSQLLLLRG